MQGVFILYYLLSSFRNHFTYFPNYLTIILAKILGGTYVRNNRKCNRNHSILYAKSILDGVLSIVFASSLGLGVLFSAASVFIYQGSITMCAIWLQPFITDNMLREIGIVGGILITIIGLNLLNITKIKVGNMLPSVLVPIIYYLVVDVISNSFFL
ncbi:MAG: DUF554 family protein [Eubacteriales bacterium]